MSTNQAHDIISLWVNNDEALYNLVKNESPAKVKFLLQEQAKAEVGGGNMWYELLINAIERVDFYAIKRDLEE